MYERQTFRISSRGPRLKHLEQEQEKARRALQQYTEELRKLDEMKWNDLKDFDDVGNWYSHNHGKLHF